MVLRETSVVAWSQTCSIHCRTAVVIMLAVVEIRVVERFGSYAIAVIKGCGHCWGAVAVVRSSTRRGDMGH